MASSSKDLAARAKRAGDRQPANSKKPAEKPKPNVKPVRLSVDLQPADYRRFGVLCMELAEESGRPRVAGMDVIRALIAEVQVDEELRAKVIERMSK